MGIDIVFMNPLFPGRFNGAPINLLALGSYLAARGYSVKIMDLSAFPVTEHELLTELVRMSPRLVAIGSYSPSHVDALQLAKSIRSGLPEIPIVKGGIHESIVPSITLKRHPYIDFTIQGDGEKPLEALLERISRQNLYDLADIHGLTFRNYQGEVIVNAHEPTIPGPTLDEYPIMDRSLLEHCGYYDFPIFNGKNTAQVLTSRGCHYNCSFCPGSRYQSGAKGPFRWRSVSNVRTELRELRELGYTAIFFDDSVFTANKRRTYELCSILKEMKFEWACQTRVDCVDDAVLRLMADSGCSYIYYGVETGQNHELATMNKGIRASWSWAALKATRDFGIRVGVSVIVGYQGQASIGVEETLRQIRNCQPDYVSLSIYALYPGCEDWESALRLGRVQCDSYEVPYSREDIWQYFDEGIGAIHIVDAQQATELLDLASGIIGPSLFRDLPQPTYA